MCAKVCAGASILGWPFGLSEDGVPRPPRSAGPATTFRSFGPKACLRLKLNQHLKMDCGVNGMHCSITTSEKPRRCRTSPGVVTRLTNTAVLLVLLVAVLPVPTHTGSNGDTTLTRLAKAVKALNQRDRKRT